MSGKVCACYVIEASDEEADAIAGDAEAALAAEDEDDLAEAALAAEDKGDLDGLLSDSGNYVLEFEDAAESVVDACAPVADDAAAPAPPAAADGSAIAPAPPAAAAGSAVAHALPAVAPIVPAGAAAAIVARGEHELTIKNWHGSIGMNTTVGGGRRRMGNVSERLVWEVD